MNSAGKPELFTRRGCHRCETQRMKLWQRQKIVNCKWQNRET